MVGRGGEGRGGEGGGGEEGGGEEGGGEGRQKGRALRCAASTPYIRHSSQAHPPHTPPGCPHTRGVELGKVLANKVRGKIEEARAGGRPLGPADGFNASTTALLNRFLAAPVAAPGPGEGHSFPPGLEIKR